MARDFASLDINLLSDILKHLPIADILNTCSSLPSQSYQTVCKNQPLWKYLLYRDYGVFSPVIHSIERESYMSYFDLYQEFYHSPLFNSADFRRLYKFLLEYIPIPIFLDSEGNETPIPILVEYIPVDPKDPNQYGVIDDKWYKAHGSSPPYRLYFISNKDLALEIDLLVQLARQEYQTSYIGSRNLVTIPLEIKKGQLRFLITKRKI